MTEIKVDVAYTKALAKLRSSIEFAINNQQLEAASLLRLAMHDATTYAKATNTSGATGSIRYVCNFLAGFAGLLLGCPSRPRYFTGLGRTKKELEQPGNEGLDTVVAALASAKATYPGITNAGELSWYRSVFAPTLR